MDNNQNQVNQSSQPDSIPRGNPRPFSDRPPIDNGYNQPPMGQPMQPQNFNPQGGYGPQNFGPQGYGPQGYNQPLMGQPISQPMMKPPKQPMDPAKKKKLIIGLSVCGAVLILSIAAAIVIPILLRVDYSSAYATAKELKPKVYDIYRSYDCEYAIDYVESKWTSVKDYTEYIERCKSNFSSETNDLVSKLENTDSVKRNNDVKTQFDKFKAEYTSLSSDNSDALNAKLALWQARHNFVIAADKLSTSSSDAEFTTAANYLINSGNDTLKAYGEGWLERRIAINAAYRAYYNASYSNPNYNQLREDYNNKKNEYNDWIATNKPDIKTVAPLSFNDTSKMYSEFTKLYDLITDTYEKNYNFGSHDCSEIADKVTCD